MNNTTTPLSPRELLGKTRDETIALNINDLPDENIFCPVCDRVVWLNVRSPLDKGGKCLCGTLVVEYKSGRMEWHEPIGNGQYRTRGINPI